MASALCATCGKNYAVGASHLCTMTVMNLKVRDCENYLTSFGLRVLSVGPGKYPSQWATYPSTAVVEMTFSRRVGVIARSLDYPVEKVEAALSHGSRLCDTCKRDLGDEATVYGRTRCIDCECP